jgi:CheY-like chemotaxis protein
MNHILVIDDEDSILTMVCNFLKGAGYHVFSAHDGKQALQFFETNPIDLIITDIFMPEKDGLEVIITMRNKHPDVPVIAITGGAYLGILHVAQRIGAVCTLEKPFKLEDLLAAIRRYLPAGHPAADRSA